MSDLIELTPEQLKIVLEQGFIDIPVNKTHVMRITKNDLRISKDDLERIKSGEFNE